MGGQGRECSPKIAATAAVPVFLSRSTAGPMAISQMHSQCQGDPRRLPQKSKAQACNRLKKNVDCKGLVPARRFAPSELRHRAIGLIRPLRSCTPKVAVVDWPFEIPDLKSQI
jgi:hypothetical protein